MTALNKDQVQLGESNFYHNDPYPIYAQMRQESPVYWYEPGGFWVLTRYEDIKIVSSAPEVFSSANGVIITDVLNKSDILSKMFPDQVENFFTSDPPRHHELKKLISYVFSRKRIMGMQDRIVSVVEEYVDKIEPGSVIDFMSTAAVAIPIKVIQEFMDLDDLSVEKAKYWSDEVFKMGSDLPEEEFQLIMGRVQEMFEYFGEKIAARKKEPKDDMIGRLVESELDGEDLSVMMAEMFCQTILVAGNETTRNGLAATVRLFADHPEQYQRLVESPELMDFAVEEVLRYHTPTIGFTRMALEDSEVGGQKISKGQHVYMIYGAANRDPAAFERPEEFDISRFHKKRFPMHLTFGYAEHACMGSALARLEMKLFLQELVKRFSRLEIVGEPERPDSILGNGYVSLPVKFTAH